MSDRSVVKSNETTQIFVLVRYAWKTTSKKSSKRGEYGPLGHLLFLFSCHPRAASVGMDVLAPDGQGSSEDSKSFGVSLDICLGHDLQGLRGLGVSGSCCSCAVRLTRHRPADNRPSRAVASDKRQTQH